MKVLQAIICFFFYSFSFSSFILASLSSKSPNEDPEVNILSRRVAVQLELSLFFVGRLMQDLKANDPFRLQLHSLRKSLELYAESYFEPRVLHRFITNCRLDDAENVPNREIFLYAYRRESCNPWLERADLRLLNLNLGVISNYKLDLMYRSPLMIQIISRISSNLPIFKPTRFSRAKVRNTLFKHLRIEVNSLLLKKIRSDFDPLFNGNLNDFSLRYYSVPSCFNFGNVDIYDAYIHLPYLQFFPVSNYTLLLK
jgi:hypothetical protein